MGIADAIGDGCSRSRFTCRSALARDGCSRQPGIARKRAPTGRHLPNYRAVVPAHAGTQRLGLPALRGRCIGFCVGNVLATTHRIALGSSVRWNDVGTRSHVADHLARYAGSRASALLQKTRCDNRMHHRGHRPAPVRRASSFRRRPEPTASVCQPCGSAASAFTSVSLERREGALCVSPRMPRVYVSLTYDASKRARIGPRRYPPAETGCP
ncbi:MAG: hypothetical protein GAK28_01828 [Luteibacter sp.]|nr:MAG: hypothetical protein GAK28_01828 [Luteibacter sp.]